MTIASPAKFLILAALLALTFTSGAHATSNDWQACRDAAARLEKQHGLPEGMVTSIALVESGRRSPDGTHQAWPWTINAEGRAYYFATRQEAVDAVRRLLAQGKRTIDVGCMQINLRFHPRAFTSVEEAFDPMSNVAYAAYFLRDLESRSDSWMQAIGRYHSFSPSLNARYTARVQAVWKREQVAATNRVATATPITPTQTAAESGLRLSSFTEDTIPVSQRFTPPALSTSSFISASADNLAR
ncbi:MAG: lytic transglycosylase [Rhodobiaceae bacterium]|nr:MAG: lytic transglycosylase [Rhodobiaceae bacterium]